jgi:hypothetical protein
MTITAAASSPWPARRCRARNTALAAAQPDRFYLPAYIGPKRWVALRLDIGNVDWEEVAEPVTASYRSIAPKRLVALLPAQARVQ